ncbi:heme peroxidase [Mycena metata]|uniref:Peroxidase n=1 Tax=Mycena metata TaxID=1033252 RepID=A0AAD7DZN1_9AGAR|nr:heme peroxidase [Mycena metata]
MRGIKSIFFSTFSLYAGVSGYVWPSPYNFLEDAYTVSSGFADGGIVAGVNPYSISPFAGLSPGRQAASEWLRGCEFFSPRAYHDMATYSIDTGLGSIGFETDRAQNVGPAMNSSLQFFHSFQSKNSSMADVIALSVILAIKNCGGPSIPFRAGRIDAENGGPETVPEPQQDIATHTQLFAQQGFNVSEMITLVACGHTIGGIHQADFPGSVENATTPTNPSGVVHFDDTFDSFDNHIATQWIDGTSVDLLAVGFNETTNLDARIFQADGNQTCGALLERMLNTVPKAVQLTDVIEPLAVKPYQLVLTLASNGSLVLTGYIRIFGTSAEAASATAADMPVTQVMHQQTLIQALWVLLPKKSGFADDGSLLARVAPRTTVSPSLSWLDRNGEASAASSVSASAVSEASNNLWGNIRFFQVNAIINGQTGISSFVVDWAFKTQDSLTHSDNGGSGFPLRMCCADAGGVLNKNTTTYAVVFQVDGMSGYSATHTAAYVDYNSNVNQVGSAALKRITTRIPLVHTGNSSSLLYNTYSATFASPATTNQARVTFDVVAVIAGETYASLNNPEILAAC